MEEDKSVVVVPSHYQPTLDNIIGAWLHAKSQRTNSEMTRRAYTNAIREFRALLQSAGCDLDSDPPLVAMIAQGWCSRGRRKETIAPATYNQRRCILSSFYSYAKKHRVVTENPIELTEARPVQSTEYAQPLEPQDVQERLKKIDRSDITGKRDYALLVLAVTTGRRVTELASMKWGDITFTGSKTIVRWPRCKGAKEMSDELAPGTAAALIDYVKATQGANLEAIPADSAIWRSVAWNSTKGNPLKISGISDVCKKYLGSPKVHTTRHSFAIAMELAGAKLSEIGDRLGHADLSTTSKYMQRLHSMENPYSTKLENLYGIGE